MAQQIIIKGTPVVGANEVLVADSNSKIPAVDGSLVTAMAGGNIAGTVPTARLDTGTTANKLVVLGASGLPVIDGSLLTGIVSYTKSASDPTISTNPSTGVGTEWVNHTTGKQFILTDATAGANVWTCSGGGSDNIEPYYYGGEAYGYSMGGGPDSSSTQNARIEKYSFTSDGNGVASGSTLSATRLYLAAVQVQSSTHGYAHGGYAGAYLNKLDKFSFSSAGTATLIGSLTTVGANSTGCNSDTYGYRCGGSNPTQNTIDRWPFASDGNATDVGDMVAASAGITSSTQGTSYGYIFNGSPGGNPNDISKFSMASSANAVSTTQTLSVSRNSCGGNTSQTYGYVTGGSEPSGTDYIDKYAFDSTSNATDIGNLTVGTYGSTSSSSTTHGYSAGRKTVEDIDKFSFATDGNATSVGDLPYIHFYAGGCHN